MGVAVIGGLDGGTVGNVIAALAVIAAVWMRYPENHEDGKDKMRVNGEKIWL